MKNPTYLILLLLYSISILPIKAQERINYFNSLAVGIGAGSNGFEIDLAAPLGNYFTIRGIYNFMPNYSMSTDLDVNVSNSYAESYSNKIKAEGTIKRSSMALLANFYPTKRSSFFLCTGFYLGGKGLVNISGHSDELKELVQQGQDVGIEVGDYRLPVDNEGNVSGGIKVANFRPYIGLGFGRAIPRKRIGFMFELGAQFHGKPEVYSNTSDITDLLSTTDLDDEFSNIANNLTVYPVIKFRLCGRLF